MSLIEASHRRSPAILLFTLLLAVAGVFMALRLPASIFPSVTFPLVKVIADVGEEPAARMMPTVTRPLEEAILRVPGIRRVLSTTSRGSTEMSADFVWGTDMQTALQRVQAEVARVRPDLPADVKVDVEWMNTSIFPILGYALTSDTQSQSQLWTFAQYTLKPALVRIPGVAQVQIQGGRQPEFQVRLDRRALEARKLAVSDVVAAIRKNNQVLSSGLTEKNHELYLSLVDGRVLGLKTLGQIPISVAGGVPARLEELGPIAVSDAVSYIRTTADGRPAVLVNVIQQPSANAAAIGDAVAKLFHDQPDLLPRDVRWTNFYDQASFVTDSVHGVRDAILIGVALAAIVLFLFLREWRLTVVAVVAIPLCVAITALLLGATGQTVNLMTLGGVAAALGLIADDAIVIVESIHRRRGEGDPAAARNAVRELLPALAGSSLSTIVIFLPFALLTGVAGAFFKPLALTMALELAVSFLLATFVVPLVVGSRGLRERAHRPRTERFARVARLAIDHSWVAVVFLVLLLSGGYVLYFLIGTDFLPSMDEGSIILDYWTPPGTSLTDTDEMLFNAEKIILGLSDVAGYSRRTGTQLGFFITEPNRGDYVIKLKPRSQRRDVDEVIDDIRKRLAVAEPVIHTDFGQLLEDDIGDLTGGVPQPIDVKIFGDDQTVLQQKARQAARIISSVSGVEDVFDGIVIAGPALDIRLRSAGASPEATASVSSSAEPTDRGKPSPSVPKPPSRVAQAGDSSSSPGSGSVSRADAQGQAGSPSPRPGEGSARVSAGLKAQGPLLSGNPSTGPSPIAPPALFGGLTGGARFGLTTEEIHDAVEPAIAGTVASNIRIGERVFDIRVFARTDGNLTDLRIRAPSGALLPLSALATVTTGPPEAEINRENLKSYVGVTGRLSGRSLGAAVGEIQSKLAADLHLPSGMSIEYGGLYEQQQSSFKGLLLVLLGGLLLVSVVLLFEFGDWRAPLLTATIALSALAGVFGALMLTGMTLNISSFVGAIMVVGIVGENAVFVIHEARLALQRGEPVPEAWKLAARRRLRPVAMTVLAGAFALAPLALALGQGSQLQQPLAIAVIGGFLLSGPLVLLVLPAIYRALDPRGKLAG